VDAVYSWRVAIHGVHPQPWFTPPDVVYTICGSHQRLFTPAFGSHHHALAHTIRGPHQPWFPLPDVHTTTTHNAESFDFQPTTFKALVLSPYRIVASFFANTSRQTRLPTASLCMPTALNVDFQGAPIIPVAAIHWDDFLEPSDKSTWNKATVVGALQGAAEESV